METINALFALIIGLLIRLAIPILLTAILIFLLRKLDAHWQSEAQLQRLMIPKPECWKIRGCSAEQIANCAGAKSHLPCWQVYRLPNGYLREECLACQVFTKAPVPALRIETRRM